MAVVAAGTLLVSAVTGAAVLVGGVDRGTADGAPASVLPTGQGSSASRSPSAGAVPTGRAPAPAATGAPQDQGAIAYIDDMRPGTCVNDVSDGVVLGKDSGVLPLADCADAHNGEVLASFPLPAGGWPGDGTVRTLAVDGCLDRLSPIFERSPFGDQLASLAFVPLREEWPDDRLVVCVAVRRGSGFLFKPVDPEPAAPPTRAAPPLGAGAA
ncbi:hypothetical protein [Streptosporangium carneum]|uniref:Septum formation-related domain-containing protein n=1 Tax=Streptosporangium carneum TaxID=47481 RepID=A0A9W6MDC3_9ACTN|nr:hypothetical protein [Streptosporangium carneum]GLK09643.1 hypothetical protein GCM10017600_30490 [Streptosporangium carneum]